MTIEEKINYCEKMADNCESEIIERSNLAFSIVGYEDVKKRDLNKKRKCAEDHRQLAEWLRELKAYREFADWLAHAVLEEDWEESGDFYAEVLCRKLTKLGKLKVVDNKYMEVNADED